MTTTEVKVNDSTLGVFLRVFSFVELAGGALVFAGGWLYPYLAMTYAHQPVSIDVDYQVTYIAIVLIVGLVAVFGKSNVGSNAVIGPDGVRLEHGRRHRDFDWSQIEPLNAPFTGDIRFRVHNRLPMFTTRKVARAIILSEWAPPWSLPPDLRRALAITEEELAGRATRSA